MRGAFARYLLLCTFVVVPRAFPAPTHLVTEPPVTISEVDAGLYLVDFGRVAFGNITLTGADHERQRVRLHFGEALADGRVDRNPPGTVRYRETGATLVAAKPKTIAPGRDERNTRTTSETDPPAIPTPPEWDVLIPFRWVEIEGFRGTLQQDQVARRAAYLRDWDDNAASFHSSSDILNRIWELSRHSIKATSFAGIYVDGDRERIPYEGDAYLNQLSHYYTDYDKQMARDTFDHLMLHPTWPTEWSSHMVFMAHTDWLHTGDTKWLRERYSALQEKLLLDRSRQDGLVTSTPAQIEKGDLVDWPPGERDGHVFTHVNTVVNAFHLRTLHLMAELATALGETADAARYRATFNRTLDRFNAELFAAPEGLYRDGIGTGHHSLHANLFPLAFGLVPEERRDAVASWLADRGMRCSVYAAQYLLEALFENGHARAALELMTAEGDRSWRHMLDSGATITWEAWDAKYKPNLDWNHAWGAAPANLLPRYILGIEPLTPGWTTARVRPRPGNLSSAGGTVPTPLGPVSVDWALERHVQLRLNLPPGIKAHLELPVTPGSNGVTVNGRRVTADQAEGVWRVEKAVGGSIVAQVTGR